MGKKETIWFYSSIITLFLIFLVVLGSQLDLIGKEDLVTGYAVYGDELSKTYTSDTIYLWTPQQTITLEGLALSGIASGTGSVKSYLIYDGQQYLINEFTLNDEVRVFNTDCRATCNLEGFSGAKYLIRFEISDGVTYTLNTINYSTVPLDFVDSSIEVLRSFNNTLRFQTSGFATLIADLESLTCAGALVEYNGSQAYSCSGESVATYSSYGVQTLSFGGVIIQEELSEPINPASVFVAFDGDKTLVLEDEIYRLSLSSGENTIEVLGINNLDDYPILNAKIVESDFSTPIFAINESLTFSNATITLEKNGEVNSIIRCSDYDIESESCGVWQTTDLEFVDDGDSITFSPTTFSAYAGSSDGGEIEFSSSSVSSSNTYLPNTSGSFAVFCDESSDSANPPNAQTCDNEYDFTAANNATISTPSGAIAMNSYSSSFGGVKVNFSISETSASIVNMSFQTLVLGEGPASTPIEAYAWNFSSSKYELLGSATNDNTIRNISFNFVTIPADFVENGIFIAVVMMPGAGAMKTSSVYYAQLDVNSEQATPPATTFIAPTPADAYSGEETSAEINVSIESSIQLTNVTYNWNGTDYSLYDDDLVLMMNFNSFTGLNDSSRYGNNGSASGDPTYVASGKYGGAYEFDGNDYVELASLPLVGGTSTPTQFTISLWLNRTASQGSGGQSRIFTQADAGLTSSGNLYFMMDNAGTFSYDVYEPGGGVLTTGSTYSNNQWYHVVLTRSGSYRAIYVDGVLAASDNSAETYSSGGSITRAIIGGTHATHFFTGKLDEFMIWNRSLSESEIEQIYMSSLSRYNSTQWYLNVNQSKNGTSGLDLGDYSYFASSSNADGVNTTETRTLTVASALVPPSLAYELPTPVNATTTTNTSFVVNASINASGLSNVNYVFNGTNYSLYDEDLLLMMNFDSSTLANDSSLEANHGTANGDAAFTAAGKYGGAYTFDGDGDYVDVGTNINSFSDITMSAWVKRSQSMGATYMNSVIAKDFNSGGRSFAFGMCGSSWSALNYGCLEVNGDLVVKGIGATTQDEWYHFAWTYDGTTYRFYENGVLAENTDDTAPPTSTTSMTIGRRNYPSFEGYFPGDIDEVRIWNRSFSVDEIEFLYQSNLAQIDFDSYSLYVNASKNATSGLDVGMYTYFVSAQNGDGSSSLDERIITVEAAPIPPATTFIAPTPADEATSADALIRVNASIVSSTLTNVNYVWNATNYSLYDENLVMMLNFDDYTRENDTSLYARTGTLSGATWSSAGKYEGAYTFDGNEDFITFADVSALRPTRYTIAAWFKTSSTNQQQIFGNAYYGTCPGGLCFPGYELYTASGNVGLLHGTNANTYAASAIASSATYHDNLWHFVVATYDGSNLNLYVDGLRAATPVSAGAIAYASDPYVQYPRSGTRRDTNSAVNSIDFTGQIDEIRLWNISFSEDQIQQLYTQNLAKFNSTQWYLNVNQTKNGTADLGYGAYDYLVSSQSAYGSNSTETRTFTILPPYDFVVSGAFDGGSILEEDVVTANATVLNNASQSAEVNVSLYVDDVYAESGMLSLSANDTQTYNFTWSAVALNHTLKIAVDPTAEFEVLDASKNNVSQAVVVYYSAGAEYLSPNGSFARGSDLADEDALGEIVDTIPVYGRVFNVLNQSQGLSGTCDFFLNETTLLGSSSSNASGECVYQFNKTAYAASDFNISVNVSALTSQAIFNGTLAEGNFSTFVFDVETIANNFASGSTYVVGDVAVLNLTVLKDGVLYSPSVLSVQARGSAGLPAFPGTLYEDSTGKYRYASPLNQTPSGGYLRWHIRVNDTVVGDALDYDELSVGTAVNEDVQVDTATANITISIVNGSNGLISGNVNVTDGAMYEIFSSSSSSNVSTSINAPKNHTISVRLASGSSIKLTNVALNTSSVTFAPQFVDAYAGSKPTGVSQVTQALGVESFNYALENANLTLLKNGVSVANVYRCDSWSASNANCSGSWSDAGAFAENATHIWFEVDTFSGYIGASDAEDTTPPVANLIAPANGSSSESATIIFNGTFSDDTALKNATLYIWNGTTLIGNNDTSLGVVSTIFLDPNVDGSTTEWTPSSGVTHYVLINDTARDPTVPDTGTYIVAGNADGTFIEEIGFNTTTGILEATNVTIHTYLAQSGSGTIETNMSIFIGGAWSEEQSNTGANSWATNSFSGSWTQADIDALQVRYSQGCIGTGEVGCIRTIYATYAEVTYLSAVTSSSANLSFTLPGEGEYLWNYEVYDTANNSAFNATNYTITYFVPDTTAPVVSLVAPLNGSNTTSATVLFNATFSDDVALANSTFMLWNSSGDLINETTTVISGLTNSTNLSVVLPYEDVFLWNYLANDTSGNSAVNATNFTFTYALADSTAPNLSSPPNTSATYPGDFSAQFNATDNVAIGNWSINDSRFFGINQSGYLNNSGAVPVNNYSILVSVNDTFGNLNSSVFALEVTPAGTELTLLVNGSFQNLSFVESANVNVTVLGENGTLALLRNGVSIIGENGSDVSYSAGDYNITAILTSGVNHTPDRTSTLYVNVSVFTDTTAPVVTLVAPGNGSSTAIANVSFNASFVDDAGLLNATLYVWNGSSTLYSEVMSLLTPQTNYTDPTADLVSDLTPSAGDDHYALLVDSARFNTTPELSTYVSATGDGPALSSGREDVFNISTSEYDHVENITLWVYGHRSSGTASYGLEVGLYLGGVWINDLISQSGDLDVDDAKWRNLTIFGDYTSEDLANLQARINISGGGSPGNEITGTVYALYVEIGNGVGPLAASTNTSYVLPAQGTYLWNYEAIDTSGNSAFNATNYTITYFVPDTTSPIVSLVAPLNGSNTTSATVVFNASFVDDVALANSTFMLWNSSGSLVNETTAVISGLTNSTNLSVVLPYQGNFTWNYQANDTSGNSAVNATNYTLEYFVLSNDITACLDITTSGVYPVVNTLNASGTCINVLADDVKISCDGNEIGYANTLVGYAVNNSGFDNLTVEDCVMVQGNSSSLLSTAIQVSDVTFVNVTNTSFGLGRGSPLTASSASQIYFTDNTVSQENLTSYSSGLSFYVTNDTYIERNVLDVDAFRAIDFGYSRNMHVLNNTFSGANTFIYVDAHPSYPTHTILDGADILYNSMDLSDSVYGVFIRNSGGRINENNITSNSASSLNSDGVSLFNARFFELHNNSITGIGTNFAPLRTRSSYNGSIVGNVLESENNAGFHIVLTGGEFYNNLINESFVQKGNFQRVTVVNVPFNTSKQAGTTIVGGSFLGGNYWTSPLMNGYSDSCGDFDGDEICDSRLKLSPTATDYLPLTSADDTAPEVVLVSPQNGSYINGNVKLQTANVSDNRAIAGVYFEYKNVTSDWINISGCNDTNAPYQCNWNTNSLNEDVNGYSVRAVAYDASGNSASSQNQYFIDRTLPTISYLAVDYPLGQSSARDGQVIILNLNATDGNASAGLVNVSVNRSELNGLGVALMNFAGGSLADGETSAWNLSLGPDGTNGEILMPVMVSDASSPTSNVRSGDAFVVQVDNTAPVFGSVSDPGTPYNNQLVAFTTTVSDNYDLASFIFSSNFSGAWVNDSSEALSGTSEFLRVEKQVPTGNYSYLFYAFDDAGNVANTSSQNLEVLGDAPGFEILLIAPEHESIFASSSLAFNFSYANGNATSCSLLLGGVENETVSSPNESQVYSLAKVVSDGAYDWDVYCLTNTSGIEQTYFSPTFSFLVDSLAPNVTGLIANPTSGTHEANPIFNATIADTNAIDVVLFEFNGVNYTPENISNVFTVELSNIARGNYSYVWFANDTAGNINQSESGVYVVAQATPSITLAINDDEDNVTIDLGSSALVNGTLVSGSGLIQLYENGTLINEGLNVTNSSTYSDATYLNFTLVYAENENYSSVSVSRFLTVANLSDVTAPTITLISPSNASTTTSASVDFVANISDAVQIANATLILRNSSGNIINSTTIPLSGTANTSSISITLPSAATYLWAYESSDNSSNVASSVNRTLTYSVSTPPSGGGGGGGGGGSSSCSPEWECGSWTSCIDGTRTRSCVDSNSCGVSTGKPSTSEACGCSNNNECSNPGYVSANYCSGNSVVKDYSEGICNSGSCSLATAPRVVEACSGGTPVCSSGACVECTSDSQCGVGFGCSANECVLEFFSCEESWQCSSWSSCSGGIQTRSCSDASSCGTQNDKPSEAQGCEANWDEDDPYVVSTELKTGNGLVPCYESTSVIGVERSIKKSDIRLPLGRSIITDPFEVTCSGGYSELTAIVPYGFEEYKVHRCRGDSCQLVTATEVTDLLCDSGIIEKEKRLIDSFIPEYNELDIALQNIEVSDNRSVSVEGFELTFIEGEESDFTLQSIGSPVALPANPQILVIGTPIEVSFASAENQTIEVILPYGDVAQVEENTLRVYAYVNESWRYLGGSVDTSENKAKSNISLGELGNNFVLAVAGIYCEECGKIGLDQVYDAQSSVAVVLVHGFDTGPGTYQALVNDIALTGQPVDAWLFSYPHNQSLGETIAQFDVLLESELSSYDKIIIVGHSLGGIIAEASVREGYELGKDYVSRVSDVILLGVPNLGFPPLQRIESIFNSVINTQTLFKIFDVNSASLNDLSKFQNTPKVPGIEYKVVAGSKPYEFGVGALRVRSDNVLNLLEVNDGLIATTNARTVGGEEINSLCENYWELNLTHTDLNDKSSARNVVKGIIAQRVGFENTTLGSTQYLKIVVDSCESGDTFFISGVRRELSADDLCILGEEAGRINSCSDGVQNSGEKGIDCGGPCGPCLRSYLLLVAFLAALGLFIFYVGREVAHTRYEHRRHHLLRKVHKRRSAAKKLLGRSHVLATHHAGKSVKSVTKKKPKKTKKSKKAKAAVKSSTKSDKRVSAKKTKTPAKKKAKNAKSKPSKAAKPKKSAKKKAKRKSQESAQKKKMKSLYK